MPFLLERLAARPLGIDGRREDFDESAAIQAQLQRLFHARNQADGAAALIGWGLPNVVEIGSHDMAALGRYAELARQAILAHEPRLRNVSVAVAPQADALTPVRLQIGATLVDSGAELRFDLALNG